MVHPDIKKQILELIKEGGAKVQDVAQEHGLSPKTIWGWMARGATAGPSIMEYAKLKRENLALKELIGAITLELSHEKKRVLAVKEPALTKKELAKKLGISRQSLYYNMTRWSYVFNR